MKPDPPLSAEWPGFQKPKSSLLRGGSGSSPGLGRHLAGTQQLARAESGQEPVRQGDFARAGARGSIGVAGTKAVGRALRGGAEGRAEAS